MVSILRIDTLMTFVDGDIPPLGEELKKLLNQIDHFGHERIPEQFFSLVKNAKEILCLCFFHSFQIKQMEPFDCCFRQE